MNIRKNIDYSEVFSALDKALTADLPQMKLYCEIGRLICTRVEKGTAVAVAAYLAEHYPETTGFSPRNLRRMRDFYKLYAECPDLMAQAMRIGWTQNVVILEADLTMEQRSQYLQAASQNGWSKIQLQKQIETATNLQQSLDNDGEICYTEQQSKDAPSTTEITGGDVQPLVNIADTTEMRFVDAFGFPRAGQLIKQPRTKTALTIAGKLGVYPANCHNWLESQTDPLAHATRYSQATSKERQGKRNDKTVVSLPRQHLPQPNGRICDERPSTAGRAGRPLSNRIGSDRHRGDRQPGLSAGAPPAGRA